MKLKTRKEFRKRRHLRVRKRISGTVSRPRMAIFLSSRHIQVQFIDDVAGVTLASAKSDKSTKSLNLALAKTVGEAAAEAAKANGIDLVVVDRGGFRFHGKLKQVVESMVEGGVRISTKEAK